MAETLSTMIPLGTQAPSFKLYDTISQKKLSLNELASPIATVIMFLCNHCPYVKNIQKKLVELVQYYQEKNITFIAISSNDVEHYPADRPEKMREEAIENHYSFPYLYDVTQEVAKVYQATCTPDFFIFDAQLSCVYRGRFDDSTPGNKKTVSGKDLSAALDALLMHQPISAEQQPSLGCNIKWKKT